MECFVIQLMIHRKTQNPFSPCTNLRSLLALKPYDHFSAIFYSEPYAKEFPTNNKPNKLSSNVKFPSETVYLSTREDEVVSVTCSKDKKFTAVNVNTKLTSHVYVINNMISEWRCCEDNLVNSRDQSEYSTGT